MLPKSSPARSMNDVTSSGEYIICPRIKPPTRPNHRLSLCDPGPIKSDQCTADAPEAHVSVRMDITHKDLPRDPEAVKFAGKFGTCKNAELIFEEIWATVKQEKLVAGQPRSGASMRALGLGRLALSIAESTGELQWEAEACSIMAYVLNANESYSDSLSYYEQAVEKLEAVGRQDQAARVRIGYIYALVMSGRSHDATQIAHAADEWFLKIGDETGHAKDQL